MENDEPEALPDSWVLPLAPVVTPLLLEDTLADPLTFAVAATAAGATATDGAGRPPQPRFDVVGAAPLLRLHHLHVEGRSLLGRAGQLGCLVLDRLEALDEGRKVFGIGLG